MADSERQILAIAVKKSTEERRFLASRPLFSPNRDRLPFGLTTNVVQDCANACKTRVGWHEVATEAAKRARQQRALSAVRVEW
jgi:hypothetical protein